MSSKTDTYEEEVLRETRKAINLLRTGIRLDICANPRIFSEEIDKETNKRLVYLFDKTRPNEAIKQIRKIMRRYTVIYDPNEIKKRTEQLFFLIALKIGKRSSALEEIIYAQ